MRIPEGFSTRIARRPADDRSGSDGVDGDMWLAHLPALVDRCLDSWDLRLDGDSWYGENALVLPVRRHDGERAALKLTWPHREATTEHLALRAWAGRGAVRMLAASPADRALLLERLDGDRDLTTVPILEACEEIGRLFRVLDHPALPQLDTVAAKAEQWRGELAQARPTVPRRLTEQALSVLDDLLVDAPQARMVHEDLHDMNVLAPLDPQRGDWLAIDPKPVAGEWAYAVAPIVWNREDAAERAHSFRTHVRLRAEVVADEAGLDLDRVQAWTLVRLTVNAVWAAQFPAAAHFHGRMIALAKAFSEPLGW